MKASDRDRYPPVKVALRNGAEVVLRLLSADDGEKLGDFYEQVPREDFRFYCPHPLDMAHALKNAANALSPLEIVIVLDTPDGRIGGYAWCRWREGASEIGGCGVCVGRDWQGLGAGGWLMWRLVEIARDIGPAVMSLTVQKANARALSLYKQAGFKIGREQVRAASHGFAAEGEYYMELRLR